MIRHRFSSDEEEGETLSPSAPEVKKPVDEGSIIFYQQKRNKNEQSFGNL